ncbi:MAG: biotin--[acetyl-CoA-carboxylase] ligase [Candidatus Symbiobacter sp.]|nr:biotin--[acetyl-CoA-carboxylase] ligase [Candidatus Symbiobacter sp.]
MSNLAPSDAAAVVAAAAARPVNLPPGYRFVWYDEIDSTNARAKILAQGTGTGTGTGTGVATRSATKSGENNGEGKNPLVVAAGLQTQGRGRQGRAWWGCAGNLYYSLLLYPRARFDRALSPSQAGQISLVTAVACQHMLQKYCHDPAAIKLKWPNDLLYVDRQTGHAAKIGGILVETEFSRSQNENLTARINYHEIDFLVIGVGLNLVASPPPRPEYRTTHLSALIGLEQKLPPLENILAELTYGLDHWLDVWQTHGFAPIGEAWMAAAFALGHSIALPPAANRPAQSGIFLGINDGGGIKLQTEKGLVQNFYSGDWQFPAYHMN